MPATINRVVLGMLGRRTLSANILLGKKKKKRRKKKKKKRKKERRGRGRKKEEEERVLRVLSFVAANPQCFLLE